MPTKKKILLALAVTILAIVFAEISLQCCYRVSVGMWLHEWWAIPIFEADSNRVYRVKSNLNFAHKTREYSVQYYSNAQGMRTTAKHEAVQVEKPKDVYRVLMLGASFAFGWGADYENTYAYIIGQNLHVPGRRVEIVNLGTPSQPVCYQLRWLKNVGDKYNPDMIIQTVYGTVDYIDADDSIPTDTACVRDGYLYTDTRQTAMTEIMRVKRYSALLFYGWQVYERFSRHNRLSGMGTDLYKQTPEDEVHIKDADIAQKYFNYSVFVNEATKKNIPVVFIHIPFAYTVRPSDIIRVKHRDHTSPLMDRKMAMDVASTLSAGDINFIDTTGALIEKDKKTRMYYFLDIHLTKEGNRIVADECLPAIQRVIDKNLAHGG
jgi:hypothetical protein